MKTLLDKCTKYKIVRRELLESLSEDEILYIKSLYEIDDIKTGLTFYLREIHGKNPCHNGHEFIPMGPVYCIICGNKLQDKQRLRATKGCQFRCQQLNPEVKEKQKMHFISAYGVENAQQIPEVKLKKEQTQLKNHGVKYCFQKPDIKQRQFNTMIAKYGVKHALQCPKIHDKQKKTNLEKYGCENSGALFNKLKSKGELEVLNFIKQNYNKTIISGENTLIPFYQLDIYIPDLNLAIEFNGDYWHSHNNDKRKSGRHVRKTNDCESKGIRLIHIWEHEWKNNQDYVKYILVCYLNNKIPQTEDLEKLNRDYFSRLDFPDLKVEPAKDEIINNKFIIRKTGFLIFNLNTTKEI